MPDKEKVIEGLKYCTITDGIECPNCPYRHEDDCIEMLTADALELLKEQPQIVRCKKCKYCDTDTLEHCWCKILARSREPDWFCADGERKE